MSDILVKAIVTVIALLVVAFFLAHESIDSRPFSCRFIRIAGNFETDAAELERTTSLVTVYRDGRKLMIRRSDLIHCEEIVDDE